MSSSKSLEAARAAVVRLFDSPPVNMAELKERVTGLPKDDLRRALIEQLEKDRVPEHLHALFDSALRLVKPGNLRGRLSAIALDANRPDTLRALALGALLGSDAAEARRVAERLAPGEHERLMAVPLRSLAAALMDSDAPGASVKELCAASAEMSAIVVFEIEAMRRQRGVSASEIYGPALEAGLLRDQRLSLVQAIGADGDATAIALLERLRDAAGADEDFRSACQASLMRARSARIAPAAKPAAVAPRRAWVTTCDGQGAFTILAEFPGKPGSDPTLANLCIRAASDIRDGFLEAIPARLVPGFAEQFEQVSRVVPVPGEVAAALAVEGIARTEELRKAIPKDARRSVRLLSQVEHEALPAWPVAPAPMPSRERVQELFLAAEHRIRSWFFDDGDFSAARELPPLPADLTKRTLEKWLRTTAIAMDTPEIRARLVEMARHEARCLAWSGDEAEAAVFVALGRDAEENGLRQSPWAHAMILQGVERTGLDADDLSCAEIVGDPVLRKSLRGQFFTDVENPTGRDLARLDFTELCFLALEDAAAELPGHRRPADGDLREAAHELGVAVADAVIADVDENAMERLVAGVVSSRVGMTSPDEIEGGTNAILVAIDDFIELNCASCRHACLERPDAAMRKAFVSDTHPAH